MPAVIRRRRLAHILADDVIVVAVTVALDQLFQIDDGWRFGPGDRGAHESDRQKNQQHGRKPSHCPVPWYLREACNELRTFPQVC